MAISNKKINFSVSEIFQKRLAQSFQGEERSNVEIAKEIGISKDVFIRAIKYGLIPGTRSMIKIADYLEESIDYLLGLAEKPAMRKSVEEASFTERLAELRLSCGKRYGTVAAEIGISRSQFTTWKQKNYLPSIEICYQLSRYFNVSVDYILGRD